MNEEENLSEAIGSFWQVAIDALSPTTIYGESWDWALYVSMIGAAIFPIAFALDLIRNQFSMMKGEKGDVMPLMMNMFIALSGYGLYIVLAGAVVSFFDTIYSAINAYATQGILAELLAEMMALMGTPESFSLSNLGQSLVSALFFIFYMFWTLMYYILSKCLQYAHALTFGFLLVSGTIIIPMSIWKPANWMQGWFKMWATILFWPIVEWMIGGLVFGSIEVAIDTMQAHPFSETSPYIVQPIIYTIMGIATALMCAVTVAAPFLASAIVTNSGNVASTVVPFTAAGAWMAKQMTDISKKMLTSDIPGSSKAASAAGSGLGKLGRAGASALGQAAGHIGKALSGTTFAGVTEPVGGGSGGGSGESSGGGGASGAPSGATAGRGDASGKSAPSSSPSSPSGGSPKPSSALSNSLIPEPTDTASKGGSQSGPKPSSSGNQVAPISGGGSANTGSNASPSKGGAVVAAASSNAARGATKGSKSRQPVSGKRQSRGPSGQQSSTLGAPISSFSMGAGDAVRAPGKIPSALPKLNNLNYSSAQSSSDGLTGQVKGPSDTGTEGQHQGGQPSVYHPGLVPGGAVKTSLRKDGPLPNLSQFSPFMNGSGTTVQAPESTGSQVESVGEGGSVEAHEPQAQKKRRRRTNLSKPQRDQRKGVFADKTLKAQGKRKPKK